MRGVILRNIESGSSGRISRRDLQQTIGAVLEEQRELSSIYAQFEPDAYDGQDRYFTGDVEDHSSDQGTLEIYYYRSPEDKVLFNRTPDPAVKYFDSRNEFGIREAEWYLCSMDTRSPCVMEPYEYEIEGGYSELMTSLVMPILSEQNFAGVVGVDINLSTFQPMLSNVSEALYDGQSRITLLSEKGLIAGTSHYLEYLGQPLAKAIPDNAGVFTKLHSEQGTYDTGETLAVSFPIDIDQSGAQWSLLIELPRAAALAELADITQLLSDQVSATAARQLLVGIAVSVMALLGLVMLVRSVTRPLEEIRDRMQNLASSEGDLTHELNIDTHAELIALAGGFNQFLARLRAMVNDLKTVNVKVREQASGGVQSTQGILATAVKGTHEANESLAAVVERIATIVEHVTHVATAAEEQSAVSEEINRNLTGIGDAASDLMALAERVRNSGQALDGQVEALDKELGRLKT